MIYKFRIILDAEEDVFRDIEIESTDNLEDLNNAIAQAFGFDGSEMASFYLSDNEWNQGEEIVQFDMSEGVDEVRIMSEIIIEDILDKQNSNIIYVYDYYNMWTFFVELAAIDEKDQAQSYPNLLFAHGQLPDSPPNKQFEAEKLSDFDDEPDDDFDVDNYENFDFDENWN
ncbi:plasmid pRiA4b ORF-3 family protein [Abyssalbus ytuae]|uniref:Plasmid pRiA4b ORF-3 family protein n=1 Tax=Abyssalbus ytuae TaxID=2926907 RepID=A0A9E6ZWV3_9FLAO|nr:plasmid pRiA4b ORF-3 family protein [Abyssalbus ytuae]UOB18271.1 plasmid pRiA4b ORF-3 family protein [Abyssalbus ytuae]